jgi:uncharacterized membrane protein YphA (DoxX/SURF4 family)
MKIAIWLARILIAAVFLYAGIVKMGASERFAITTAQFSILPPATVGVAAMALPWLEILTAVLLLVPLTSRLGALCAAGLLVTFIGVLAWGIHQGWTIDCGCFGNGDEPPAQGELPIALGRDVVLLAITLGLALRRTHRKAPQKRTES